MGFETQEQAESFAEAAEFAADQRKEERLLTGMSESTRATLRTIERCVTEGGASLKTALESAYQLGKFEGGMEMASIGQKLASKLLQDDK